MTSADSRSLIAEQVRQRRLHRSWSQSQLSEVAGVSLRTIQRLERSGRCSHETLLAVAEAFEIDVRELTAVLYRESEKKRNLAAVFSRLEALTMVSKIGLGAARLALVAAVLYFVLLVAITVFAAGSFTSFYSTPPIPRESAILESHAGYHQFLQVSGLALALYLGIATAAYGLQRGRLIRGLFFLGLGVVLSTAAYSLLPWVLFEFDQYSPGFLWLLGNLGPLVLSWFLVTLFGWLFLKSPITANR